MRGPAAAGPGGPGGGLDPALRRALVRTGPLLAGVALLMAGNGMTSTLLGVRAGLEGFSPTVTGLVLSSYYAGFVAGSLVTPRGIHRVGHVRIFAGLASLASAAVLVHAVTPSALTWAALRATTGLCLAGLFVVTETWMNAAATNATRGGLLAAYMTVLSGAMAAGQVLLWLADPGGFRAFVLASVLVSLAVVPVSLTPVATPEVPELEPMSLGRVTAAAPLAVVGAVASGFVVAAVVATTAVYATLTGLGVNRTALLVAAPLALAVGVHLPVGRSSDRVDRRRVIVALGLAGGASAVAAGLVGPGSYATLVGLVAAAGGLAFPLYALSNAHLNDYLPAGSVAAAGARVVLLNGAGAIAGPVAAAVAMEVVGPGALFALVAVAYGFTAGFAIWRIGRRAPAGEDERSTYVAFPTGASTAVARLEPAAPGRGGAPREGS